jgi:hypothetical protein
MLDGKGNLVVFRLTDVDKHTSVETSRRGVSAKLAGEGPCKIVVVEDSLSPPEGKGAGKTFRDLLKERLSARFPNKRFEIVRVGETGQSAVYPPLERLASVESDVVAAQPDMVIWTCSLSDILNYVPIETFDRYLKASVEMIQAQTKADILLVSCPPVIVNPEIGHGYAFAMKKVGLRYDVPSVDLFSVFCRMGDSWQSLFRDELNRSDPVFCLYPNSAGQELIANEIFERLVE